MSTSTPGVYRVCSLEKYDPWTIEPMCLPRGSYRSTLLNTSPSANKNKRV